MEPKEAFFDTIKREFAPRLRDVGFKGSGQDFRRVSDEIIQAVNIQGRRHGGSCALNIGLHATFLPAGWQGELPNISKIKEIDCEFRGRVTPNEGADYWWEYGSTPDFAIRSARHLAETFFDVAIPEFEKLASVKALIDWLPIDAVIRGDYMTQFELQTICRALLAMARTHQHLGNREDAKAFAAAGLARVGRGVRLIPQFESILNDSL